MAEHEYAVPPTFHTVDDFLSHIRSEDEEVLGRLKREARARGHVAYTMRREDVTLYLMWILGIIAGACLAAGRR